MKGYAMRSTLLHMLTLLLLSAGSLGCVHVAPENVARDRFDYSQAVGESWKEQTLINIVRLRYGDAPTFLEVTSVINTYSEQASVSGGGTLPAMGGMNTKTLSVGGSGSWSNTPTVTYQPLTGQKFTQNLLRSLPPKEVFQMIESGWPIRLILPTALRSINGLSNQSLGRKADPGFDQLVEALGRLQRSRAVGIRVDVRQAESPVLLVLGGPLADPALQEDQRVVRQRLGIRGDSKEFKLTLGAISGGDNEIAVLTRSMLEIMLELSFGIDVPPDHLAEGRAGTANVLPGETPADPIISIRTGRSKPADAFVAVPYRDYWYWIDDTDRPSKTRFTFLMLLFSLAESGQVSAAPVVTVGAGR
jgi:hypothetical protein